MKNEYLDRANRIATDNISSAQQILKDTLDLLLDFCMKHSVESEFKSELRSISTTLSNAQSQMAALTNITRLIISASDRLTSNEVCPYIATLRKKVDDASARTASQAAALIAKGHSYATLSQSEFVIKTFEAAARENRFATVYVMESRPLFEGRQTARSLKAIGHEAILVSDASIGFFINKINAAFVGADAILFDGTIVNKIGSLALAAACKVMNKNFYVVTSVLKFDHEKGEADFVNKEESPHEIYANPEFDVKNVYFDMVRSDLITSILTEAGSSSPVSDLRNLESSLTRLYG